MSSEHGTYARYQQHGLAGEKACDSCRAASAAYHKERRAKNPEAYAKEKAEALANNKALWRLAAIHPVMFRALCEEERQKVREARRG